MKHNKNNKNSTLDNVIALKDYVNKTDCTEIVEQEIFWDGIFIPQSVLNASFDECDYVGSKVANNSSDKKSLLSGISSYFKKIFSVFKPTGAVKKEADLTSLLDDVNSEFILVRPGNIVLDYDYNFKLLAGNDKICIINMPAQD